MIRFFIIFFISMTSAYANTFCFEKVGGLRGITELPHFFNPEKACLIASKGQASRHGNILRYAQGEKVTYLYDNKIACEKGENDHCVEHRLTAVYPNYKMLVTTYNVIDRNYFTIHDGRNGDVHTFEGFPHLSPAKNGLMFMPSDCHDNKSHDWQLYTLTAKGFTLIKEQPRSDFCYDFVKFESETKVQLQRYKSEETMKDKPVKKAIFLNKVGANWVLNDR